MLDTTAYEIQSIPIFDDHLNDIYTYKMFELPKKVFLYRNLEYTVDDKSCRFLNSIIFCIQYMHVLIDLSSGCVNNQLNKTCNGEIVSSPDSCMVRKYRNHVLMSSIFPIQVLNLEKTLYDLTMRGENLVHFTEGTHLWPIKEHGSIRVICRDQYLDFTYDQEQIFETEIVMNNITLDNIEIYQPFDNDKIIDKSIDKSDSVDLKLLPISGFANQKNIIYMWNGAVTIILLCLCYYVFCFRKKLTNEKGLFLTSEPMNTTFSVKSEVFEVIDLST